MATTEKVTDSYADKIIDLITKDNNWKAVDVSKILKEYYQDRFKESNLS